MSDANEPCAVCGRWRNRATTVAGVVVRDGQVLIIRRGGEPERGKLALPGGYVDFDETTAEACAREVREETSLEVRILGLVGYYDDPRRSPTQTVSFAYLCEPSGGEARAGDDAAEVAWHPLDAVPALAFDHSRIVADARARLRI
jgi:8-oxo-dGTP diphosphatase